MGPAKREKVAIVKYDGTFDSFAEALELCDGLDGLRAGDKVLLKPNILMGGTRDMPPYGIVTTSKMVEHVLQALCDRGCADVTIGEGAIPNRELGSTTLRGFDWSGIGRVAKRYGARLVDFNSGPFEEVQLENVGVKVSKWAMESDFLIDLPVLKTHQQTKISLGMKNLKGCLHPSSKKAFHRHELNRLIALLNMRVQSSLTIIDGIYGLERGPAFFGTPHRTDLIIAGKDVFSCDIAGAMVMGIKPDEVEYLEEFASITGRTLSLDGIDLRGEPIDQVAQKFEWRLSVEDIFRRAGMDGLTIQKPGLSCCSGCATILSVLTAILTRGCSGAVLDGVEICTGGEVRAKGESQRVFLLGDCAVSANRDLKDAVGIKGCPPPVLDTVMAVALKCLPRETARNLMTRKAKHDGTKPGIFDNAFPFLGLLEPPAFDRKHF